MVVFYVTIVFYVVHEHPLKPGYIGRFSESVLKNRFLSRTLCTISNKPGLVYREIIQILPAFFIRHSAHQHNLRLCISFFIDITLLNTSFIITFDYHFVITNKYRRQIHFSITQTVTCKPSSHIINPFVGPPT